MDIYRIETLRFDCASSNEGWWSVFRFSVNSFIQPAQQSVLSNISQKNIFLVECTACGLFEGVLSEYNSPEKFKTSFL